MKYCWLTYVWMGDLPGWRPFQYYLKRRKFLANILSNIYFHCHELHSFIPCSFVLLWVKCTVNFGWSWPFEEVFLYLTLIAFFWKVLPFWTPSCIFWAFVHHCTSILYQYIEECVHAVNSHYCQHKYGVLGNFNTKLLRRLFMHTTPQKVCSWIEPHRLRHHV
jgi:hypothetical protein